MITEQRKYIQDVDNFYYKNPSEVFKTIVFT